MILLLNFLSFLIWIYLLFFHGRKLFSKEPFFWTNKFVFEKCFKFEKKHDSKEIAVVIPATRARALSVNTFLFKIFILSSKGWFIN